MRFASGVDWALHAVRFVRRCDVQQEYLEQKRSKHENADVWHVDACIICVVSCIFAAPSNTANDDAVMPLPDRQPAGEEARADSGGGGATQKRGGSGKLSGLVRMLDRGTSAKTKTHTPHNPGSSLPFHSG